MRTIVAYWPLTLICIGLPAVAAILYGCERRQTVIVDANEQTGDRCAALLEKGIALVRPDMLGLVAANVRLTSNPKEAADTLSQWLRRPDCRNAVPTEALSEPAKELITRLLGSDGVAQLTSERMTVFDAAHVRDALLDFSTADTLSRGGSRDIDRVLPLFEYVTRTVSPQATGTADLPLSAYEAHLLGRGSAEDRAWLFASLVRQLRTDAVIVRPADATANDPWWVAVLLDGGIYLFDPVLGLPVPTGKAESGLPSQLLPDPATWAEVVATPSLLVDYRQQAGIEAAPIAADRLKSPQIELIGPKSYWSLAIERLELSLTEDRGVLLFDPLHDTLAGPGLFARVAAAGGTFWNADSIRVWPYLEEVQKRREALSVSEQQRFEQRIRPYLGPVELDLKGPTPVPKPPSRELWQTRVEHMSGRPGATIGAYQHIQLEGKPDPLLPANDQSLNEQAADEAYYWRAQAQFGEQEFATAAVTAQSYIEDGGDRSDEARALRALSLAAGGQTDEAAKVIADLPETTPGLNRLQWLATRWQTPKPK